MDSTVYFIALPGSFSRFQQTWTRLGPVWLNTFPLVCQSGRIKHVVDVSDIFGSHCLHSLSFCRYLVPQWFVALTRLCGQRPREAAMASPRGADGASLTWLSVICPGTANKKCVWGGRFPGNHILIFSVLWKKMCYVLGSSVNRFACLFVWMTVLQ